MFLFGLAAHFFPDGHDHDETDHAHANGKKGDQAKKGNNKNTPAKNGKNNGAAKPKKVVDAQTEEQVF
jgi:hypothetical protein